MRSCVWLAMLLSTVFALSACEREEREEVRPTQSETAPPPAQEEMKTPAESPPPPPGEAPQPQTEQQGTQGEYMTPQEAEQRDVQSLEVVDKNISEATGQPSGIGTPGTVSGPETVVFEAKNGNVTFDHRAHGERTDCSSCHQQTPPEKIELDQESAHKLCRGCHQDQGAGPVKCTECHKKG